MSAEQQYLTILKDCYENGTDIINERTGSICRTILNQRIQFDGNEFPLLTTRKMYWKQAIGEMVAYIRAYTRLEDFHSLGVHTWDENAKGWVERIGIYDSLGKIVSYEDIPSTGVIYGASAKRVNFSYKDLLNSIKSKPNDRGHIWNFWNPEYFYKGCLRPCMYNHQFSVLNNTLHLTSTQRSADLPLGFSWNIVQCWFLLNITAKLTGLKVGTVTLNVTNAHIYENQLPFVPEQLDRPTYNSPKLIIKDKFNWDILMYGLNKDNFDKFLSQNGAKQDEIYQIWQDLQNRAVIYGDSDLAAAPSSGSFGTHAAIVAPCSINTLAKIHAGFADTLITRAAAVALKERKRLVLGVREMPFSTLALEHAAKLSALGAVIAPPVLGYYSAQNSLEDMENFIIGKWLDLLGLKHQIYKRWS